MTGLERISFLVEHDICNSSVSCMAVVSTEHGQDQDWISCRILAIFLDQDWIWIFIFENNWIRTRSGYLFDFYDEISLRVIQDVTNDGGSVLFATVFIFTKNQRILSVCAALITINNNSCYFIVNFLAKWK